MQKIVVLGASRGLGRHVCEVLTQSVESELLLVARTEQSLISACESVKSPSCSPKHLKCDVADPAQQELLFKKIEEFNPHIILNFIGGGPYGAYPEKDWKDHRWAIEVSFLFSARLLHFALASKNLSNLTQILFTGSSVAENAPDPKASSYSAAKHALRGLLYSVQAEHPRLDLRLYSPPYMDTAMLPANAWPRTRGQVYDPKDVAHHIVKWLFSPIDGNFHETYEKNGEPNVR